MISAATAMTAGIVVAREYGAAGRGTLSVLVALGTVAVLFGSFGVHYSSVYFIGTRPDETDTVLSNTALVSLTGGLLTTAVLLATTLGARSVILGSISPRLFFLFLAFVPFSYFNEFLQRALMGFGKTLAYVVPDLFEGPVLLVGTIASVSIFGPRLAPLVLLRVCIEASQSLFLGSYLLRVRRFRFRPEWRLLRQQLNYGLRNYAGSLLWLFLLRSDLVLCNHFLGKALAGVYSVAESLVMPLSLLVATLSVLLFQRTSAEADRQRRIERSNSLMRLTLPLLSGAGLILLAISHPLVILLYGKPYASAASAIVLLIPGVVLMSSETLLASFLAGEGAPLIVVWAPLVGVMLNLGANLYAIPHFGIDGAAATSSIGYAVVFIFVAIHYCRSTKTSLAELIIPRWKDLGLVTRRAS